MSKTKLVAPIRRELAYRTFIVMPPLAVAAVIGLGVWRERVAEVEFRSTIATHVSRNEPVGNASMTKFFDSRTTRETSQQWQRITTSTSALMGKHNGSTVNESDPLVPKGEPWPAEAFANALSEESQPILSELRDLAGSKKPVWLPLLFDGINVNFEGIQDSRIVARLLANEFRVAYHAGDRERAAATLSLMHSMNQITDWQGTTVVALVHHSFVGLYQNLIRESLAHEFWTHDDLKVLGETLQPDVDLDDRWSNMIAGDRAMAFSAMRAVESTNQSTRGAFGGDQLAPFGIAATHLEEMSKKLDENGSVPGAGTYAHQENIRQLYSVLRNGNLRAGSPRFKEVSITGLPFALGDPIHDFYLPAFEAASRAFAYSENTRRWTLTAVAIKQFHLQEKRWPRTLDELSLVGLPDTESKVDGVANSAVNANRFGYRILGRGNGVQLWTSYDFNTVQPVGLGPPQEHDQKKPQFTIHIR